MNKGNYNTQEQILNSLDNIERAEIPGFFYTRLKARMENEMVSTSRNRSWVFRPVFAFAALVLVILINVSVFLKDKLSDQEAAATDTEVWQSIASEYNINTNLTYEINQ